MAGYVVAEGDVGANEDDGAVAQTRITIDASCGCTHLEQRVTRFRPGRSNPHTLTNAQEVLYVAAGTGALSVGGQTFPLEPQLGVYLAQGETYEVENPGPDELVVVSVRAPQWHGSRLDPSRRTVRYGDRPVLPAGADREFRYLVNEDLGCLDMTQFVGLIPPGRAPLHSHTYDEVVYVVEGEGMLHLDGERTQISAGSCMHLPPLVEHCLENTGTKPMRVLGVFHPSGDPASRAYEANQS